MAKYVKPQVLALIGERSGIFRVCGAYRLDGYGDKRSWPRWCKTRELEVRELARECDPQFLRELRLILIALDHRAKWSI